MEYFINNGQIIKCGSSNLITIGYKHYASGTVVFTENNGRQVIQHNAGFVPRVFVMIAKNLDGEFTFNSENSLRAGIYGYTYYQDLVDTMQNLPGINKSIVSQRGMSLEWRNNDSTALHWTTNGIGYADITAERITLGYRSAQYVYLAGVEYEWYALA